MIRSMTAFARISAAGSLAGWTVEVRSINHRFFEFSLRVPPVLADFESEIRDKVQQQIRRGKVSVSISRNGEEERPKEISLNESAIKVYMAALAKLKKRFKAGGEISSSDLLKLPGVFTVRMPEENPRQIWARIEKLLRQAVDKTLTAKELEGKQLAKDIQQRLAGITKAVAKIEGLAKDQPARLEKRLAERMAVLLGDKGMDPERLHREAALLAERTDITEEVVRLRSHLELFGKRLQGTGEVGRELDFLCQEINREINTMGSKAQLFDISREVVFLKGELEKIREQIQNIE